MLNINNHPYHIVDYSPWPLKARIIVMLLMLRTAQIFFNINTILMLTSTLLLCSIPYIWWRDIAREATLQGLHSAQTFRNLKIGIILFITSEVLFFLSFFWIFFHASLTPNIELGIMWPPKIIKEFNPLSIPLLNTSILLISGVTLTASHNFLIKSMHSKSIKFLLVTLILGAYFTALQIIEYTQATFSMADSIFGSSFFVATGFHGMHVIVGTAILLVTLARLIKINFNPGHHFGFEARVWYWHFVDVVWLFLYSFIYCWFTL